MSKFLSKKFKIFIVAFFAATSMVSIALPETIIYFTEGEIKNVWINVSDRDHASFTLDSSTFWVKDADGNIIISETGAVIDGSRVYAEVDGSQWATGSELTLYIHWETAETTEKYISPIKIVVGDDYL